MARYFTPTPSQYVSQFVPPNLELMYKVGQEQAANDSALLDNLDKSESELTVKGGMYTDKEHAAQINKNIKDNLTQIRDAFYSGKVDSYQAARAMNRLKNEVANDKAYNLYKLDEAYTKSASNQIASGKWNNALGVRRNGINVFDARNGQMSINYKINPNSETEESLAELYNVQGAGEFVKEHAEIYSQIKPLINEKLIEKYGTYEILTDKKTGLPIFKTTDGVDITQEVNKNILEPMMRDYAYQNYNSLDKPSVEYMRRSGENEEDYTKRLLDSFIGYGVYDKQFGKIHYSPLNTGNGNSSNNPNFELPPTSNPLPGNKTEFGINKEGFFNTTEKYKIKKALAYATGDITTQLTSPGKDDLEPNNYSELPSSYKKVVENYVKNSPRWKGKAKQILDDSIDEAHLTVLYNEIADLNKDFTESVNYANQTGTPIVATSGSNKDLSYQQKRGDVIWNTIFNNQSSATVGDLVNSQYMIGKKVYNVKTMEEVDKNEFKDKTDRIVGLTELTPDNLLPTITGDPNMTGGFMFANGDDTYLIKNDWQEPIDLLINKIYNDLKLSTGLVIPFEQNPKYGLKMNKDGKVTIHEKTKTGYSKNSLGNSAPTDLLIVIQSLLAN